MTATAQTEDRLREICNLTPGWLDGQGEAISLTTVEHASRLIAALPPQLQPLHIYPTEPGGIEIEWRDPHGTHSMTVQPDGTLYLLSYEPVPAAPGGDDRG